MTLARQRRLALALVVGGACAAGAAAPSADAFNPLKPVCTVGGLISGLVGKACTVVEHGGRLVSAGKKLASGHLGSAVKTLLGSGGSSIGSKATFALGLAAVGTWVLGGAKYVLHATATVIGRTTSPQLRSTWFSATYWRVAGIAAVLTLPFLFAAVIQALVQSDLSLLARAALGYLPLAVLAVSIAAPLTMLLLAASDQLSAVVSSAAGNASARFLNRAAGEIGALTLIARSPFLVFFAGLLTVAGAIALWLELLLRAAAVYVIVLMLPLAFAALVWPARRMWAIRSVEVLVALILSKFAIVAVLSLGGAALSGSRFSSVSGMLAGFVLLAMGALAPWALLRLLPLGELASGAAGSWRGELAAVGGPKIADAWGRGMGGHEWAATTAEMRRQADDVGDDGGAGDVSPPPSLEEIAARTMPAAVAAENADGSDPGASFGGTAAEAAEAHGGAPAAPAERSPRLGPIWQADDFSWPAITLGIEGWPPPSLEGEPPRPPAATGPQGGGGNPELPAGGTGPLERPSPDPAPPHEDHDPTPPAQPPEDGSL